MLSGQMLFEFFATVQDPRVSRRRAHNLVDILVITFCALLSRCRSWYEIEEFAHEREEFFKSFLELQNGIPSHDTFNRVFQLVNFDAISRSLFEWLSAFAELQDGEHIHLDGKFASGSNRMAGDSRSSLGLVSAYVSRTGICLLSTMTRLQKDEGEKKSMEKLIDGLKLRKAIVTIDAAGATPTIVSKIVKQGGDYLIALKANQKSFHAMAVEHFENAGHSAQVFTTETKSHGRLEKRKYEQLCITQGLSANFEKCLEKQTKKFPNLSSIIKVSTFRTVGESPTAARTRYYFTSMKGSVEEIAKAIRSHWSIENNLHWVLDVHFQEDHCRTRSGYADANLALLRRLAISIIKNLMPGKKINLAMLGLSLNEDKLLKMLKHAAI